MLKMAIRIRCPICGMLVWQSRLSKDYNFEFVVDKIKSKGYKKIEHNYQKHQVADSEEAKMFQLLVVAKMLKKAEELMAEIDEDIELNIEVEFPEGYDEEDEEIYDEEEEEIEDDSVLSKNDRTEDREISYPPSTLQEIEKFVETEIERVSFEFETVAELDIDDLKKDGFWKRILKRRNKDIEDIEQQMIEIEIDGVDIEVEHI